MRQYTNIDVIKRILVPGQSSFPSQMEVFLMQTPGLDSWHIISSESQGLGAGARVKVGVIVGVIVGLEVVSA